MAAGQRRMEGRADSSMEGRADREEGEGPESDGMPRSSRGADSKASARVQSIG